MKKHLLACGFVLLSVAALAQGSWSNKDSINTGRYGAAGFAVGNYGYVVSGYHTTAILNDCWQYDPATDTWAQMANFPGGMRWGFAGFTIGNYGYVSCGFSSVQNYTMFNDLWRYDPSNNSWLSRASMPATGRWNNVAFAINGKGYVGVGQNSTNQMRNDFWEYDPVNDAWTQKQNFPYPLAMASSFATGSYGYIVCGNDTTTTLLVQPSRNDIHQYDPVNDVWTQKTDLPGAGRQSPATFTITGTGYVTLGKGNGYPLNMYAYNEVTDAWSLCDSFPAMGRWMTTTFTIGSSGYVVAGWRKTKIVTAETWEYNTHVKGIEENDAAQTTVHYVAGTLQVSNAAELNDATVSVYDAAGKLIVREENLNLAGGSTTVLSGLSLPAGMYVCVLESGSLKAANKFCVTQ